MDIIKIEELCYLFNIAIVFTPYTLSVESTHGCRQFHLRRTNLYKISTGYRWGL